MAARVFSEWEGAMPAAGRRNSWSLLQMVVACASLAAGICVAGCSKPPTFNELLHGKKQEEAKPAPPPAPVVKQAAPVVPPKPKKTAQEVISQWKATPPEQHTDAQLVELASLTDGIDQITEVNLALSGVTDLGIAQLPKLTAVEKLSIDNCRYGNAALQNVAKMKNLTNLSMLGGAGKDPNSDEGLAAIKAIPQLTTLRLTEVKFSDAGVSSIAEMTGLERLTVNTTLFTDEHLKMLSGLKNLKELDISETYVTDAGLQNLKAFKELEVLKMAGLGRFNGPGLKELARTSKSFASNLRSLSLFHNQQLSPLAYEGVLRLKNLEYLDVGDANVTDVIFVQAIAPLSKLEKLYLHRNEKVTDLGMKQLPKLKKLKSLLFERNHGISDLTLAQVAKLKLLENFEAAETGCTARGMKALKKKLPECAITFNGTKIEE